MTDIKFTDYAPLSGTRRTSDGFLVTQARAVRTGIQLYTGAEIGMVDTDVVRVYRPEDEVRSPASLQSFSHAPVTMGHPVEAITADNWKDFAIGEVSTAATWEDDHISLPLILKDAAAIAAVEAGTRELSAGYVCTLDCTPGTTPQGEAYDAVQRGIVINHLAVVPRGRANSTRIGDGAANWGATPCPPKSNVKDHDMTMLTVVLGDQAAQVAVADAPKVEAFKADAAKKMADAETAHAKAIADADAKLAKAEAALDAEKAKVLSDADLDKRVADRADLLAVAKGIAPEVKTAGLGDAAIRKAVVTAKLGDAVEGKSDAYIDARFDILAEADPFADSLKSGVKKTNDADPAGTAYASNVASMADAWKSGPNAKKEA